MVGWDERERSRRWLRRADLKRDIQGREQLEGQGRGGTLGAGKQIVGGNNQVPLLLVCLGAIWTGLLETADLELPSLSRPVFHTQHEKRLQSNLSSRDGNLTLLSHSSC